MTDESGLEMEGKITADDTCVFLGPLGAGKAYKTLIGLYDDANDNPATCSFTVGDCGLSVDKVAADDEIFFDAKYAGEDTKTAVTFSAYSSASSTTALGTYDSLFRAIDRARISGAGAIVKINDGTNSEVYRHGQSGRYYRYQFTAAYGYVTSTANADSWLTGYLYSHIVKSTDARLYGSNYTTAKGTPGSWALEPNSGGYYYQFGFASDSYPRASKKILLTQARLKPSQGSGAQSFNAYIFFTVQNSSVSMDAGIYSSGGNGAWKLCVSGGGTFTSGATVCTSTLNSSGEYAASSDVIINVTYTTGSLTLTATNVSTGQQYVLSRADSRIGGSPATISSASYVPDITASQTPDFRCGAYLKNIIQTESRLYNSSGTAYDFYSTSAQTHYSLRYNSDCRTLTTGSSRDTIDIFYDRAYRT
ncbi:MAG: hypothetical protein LBL35_02605 [Clostridiales bacterium]|nr:hypothetical protein [Clostridiales bacterium]